jgi:hypothetical protein
MPNTNPSVPENDGKITRTPQRFLNRIRGQKNPRPPMRDNKYQQRRENFMNERRAGIHHTSPPSRK